MHVLIANNIYPPIMAGGAELIVSYLAEGLAARGHQVTVVSTCGPEMEPYPVEIRGGVEVIRFFPRNRYWHFTRTPQPAPIRALWHLRDAWNRDAGRRFAEVLARKKPDLLHTHLIDGMSATLWRRAKRAGIPVVHTAHDYHLLCPRALMLTRSLKLCVKPQPACRLYRRWHLHTTRDIDLFCSPSRFLIETHEVSGLRVPATAVVRNGIPLPRLAPKARASGAVRKFVFPARLTVEKGCEVLLAALALLPPDLSFELNVAGKGPFEEQFRAAAGRDRRVRFLGFIQGDAKDAAFRASDCLIIPSLWYENAPVVIVEAAAYGMGVIGSRIGALPEFIRHEETGLLFETGNPASLAQAMERVVREDALLDRFAREAHTLVEMSSVEGMVENYLGYYKGLCHREGA